MKQLIITLCASVAFAIAAPHVARASNPILPLWEYIPDGEPYVFEDPDAPGKYRVYLYGSHDILATEYCGRDQVVWSAPVDDLNNWRMDRISFTSTRDRNGKLLYANGQGDVLYAPDIAVKTTPDGKKTYYLYPNNQAGARCGMIAKSDRPDGPFEVCNWSASDPRTTTGVFCADPAAFVDDDGRVYGYWGFDRSFGAEFDPETMCTVKEGTQIVEDMIPNHHQDKTFRFFEASSMRKIKDKYVFIYSRITNDGEFGLPQTNFTLAYAYSDSPLGPFTYGGTIIDGRGRKTLDDGTVIFTAHHAGNTHGSICEINGQWYVFYHRQTGTSEYARQAMVAPIEVKVTEGRGGKVEISEGEVTSEGFETNGLNPFDRHSAGIACYYTGPRPAGDGHPRYFFHGSYVETARPKLEEYHRPYDLRVNHVPVVNNTAGSVVGYKYYNLEPLASADSPALVLNLTPGGVDGRIDIFIDDPDKGTKIGSITLKAAQASEATDMVAPLSGLEGLKGKHALYFVFSSPTISRCARSTTWCSKDRNLFHDRYGCPQQVSFS